MNDGDFFCTFAGKFSGLVNEEGNLIVNFVVFIDFIDYLKTMTEADKVKISCSVREKIENEFKDFINQLDELDKLNDVLRDFEYLIQERACLTNQLKEERKQRMELEMKLNEMSELLAELEKKHNREGFNTNE